MVRRGGGSRSPCMQHSPVGKGLHRSCLHLHATLPLGVRVRVRESLPWSCLHLHAGTQRAAFSTSACGGEHGGEQRGSNMPLSLNNPPPLARRRSQALMSLAWMVARGAGSRPVAGEVELSCVPAALRVRVLTTALFWACTRCGAPWAPARPVLPCPAHRYTCTEAMPPRLLPIICVGRPGCTSAGDLSPSIPTAFPPSLLPFARDAATAQTLPSASSRQAAACRAAQAPGLLLPEWRNQQIGSSNGKKNAGGHQQQAAAGGVEGPFSNSSEEGSSVDLGTAPWGQCPCTPALTLQHGGS